MIGIYKITSPSGRIYIGQSIDLKRRIARYKSNLNASKGQSKLNRSFIKYGIENHTFEIICLCHIDLLNKAERYYQDKYNSMLNGLNLRLTKSNDKSGKMSNESVAKMLVYKNNMSEEHRFKIGLANKKNGNYPTMLGKKHSEETKNKIALSNKGKIYSEETKKKISNTKMGTIVSIETRIKKSKSVTQYDMKMNYLADYYSCREAGRVTNTHNGDIVSCCKGNKRQAGGFKWKYKDC
jgi:group I intron endonuclease